MPKRAHRVFPRTHRVCPKTQRGQYARSQIHTVWILAAKLPNSDLNFAVDFWSIFSSCFFQGERPEKIHQKIPLKIHPGLNWEKFPSDFCRSLFLTVLSKQCCARFPKIRLQKLSSDFCRNVFVQDAQGGISPEKLRGLREYPRRPPGGPLVLKNQSQNAALRGLRAPSQSASRSTIFLSELRVLLPLVVQNSYNICRKNSLKSF